jgi:hypothetical protein
MGGVFWISFVEPTAIPEGIAACGGELYPSEAGFASTKQRFDYGWLRAAGSAAFALGSLVSGW